MLLRSLSAILDQVPGSDAAIAMREACDRAAGILTRRGEDIPLSLSLNRSLASQRLYRLGDALEDAERVCFLDVDASPLDRARHRINLSVCLLWLGRIGEVIQCLDRALELMPDGDEKTLAYLSRASNRALQGDWDGFFEDLDRRFPHYETRDAFLFRTTKRWDGSREALTGKRVLVHMEQGLGDQIQCARLAQWLSAEYRPESITLSCSRPVARLLASAPGVDRVVTDRNPEPVEDDYDTVVPVMDLWKARHRLGLFPLMRMCGPYLSARYTPKISARPVPPPQDGILRVAICWQGNPKHLNDWARSVRLEEFYKLAQKTRELPIEWVSFQAYPGGMAHNPLAGWDRQDIPLLDCWGMDGLLGDMHDTAYWLQDVDLLLSVDTGQGHLGAAIGCETWFLHSHCQEWRWKYAEDLYGDHVRHFKQLSPGDWGSVMGQAASALEYRLVGLPAQRESENLVGSTGGSR